MSIKHHILVNGGRTSYFCIFSFIHYFVTLYFVKQSLNNVLGWLGHVLFDENGHCLYWPPSLIGTEYKHHWWIACWGSGVLPCRELWGTWRYTPSELAGNWHVVLAGNFSISRKQPAAGLKMALSSSWKWRPQCVASWGKVWSCWKAQPFWLRLWQIWRAFILARLRLSCRELNDRSITVFQLVTNSLIIGYFIDHSSVKYSFHSIIFVVALNYNHDKNYGTEEVGNINLAQIQKKNSLTHQVNSSNLLCLLSTCHMPFVQLPMKIFLATKNY
jgi:hypothetical protein